MAQTPAYKLLEIAAAGTFGTLCVVRDLDRGRLVALKVLKENHLHRPRVIARTRDEAAMLMKLQHPAIVKVEGLVEIEERPVVVMEWVRGPSLEEVIRAKPNGLPLAVSVELIRQATLALGAAYHAEPAEGGDPMHIIHRDVKPSNMLLSVDGELKVVDFGIARGEFQGKEAKTLSMVLGARGYLAPERLDGYDDKPSCDIYSLGICLYEFLTGRHVVLSVHTDFHAEALSKHLGALKIPDLSEPGHAELRAIVSEACQYVESRRPAHEDLVQRLDGFLTTHCGGRPDLEAYGHSDVLPIWRQRKQVRPIDHPSYPDLAFVERMARMVKWPAPPDVDQELRVFFRQPNWDRRLEELDLILVKNPHWSEDPLLEQLPTGNRSWWQFWGGKDVAPAQAVVLLRLLKERPTQAVRERALQLSGHPDRQVAAAAKELVDT